MWSPTIWLLYLEHGVFWPLLLTYCFCGLDSRGLTCSLLAGSLGLGPEVFVQWRGEFRIGIMMTGKESLWFGGGRGAVLIMATHSSCHCPSPLSQLVGPSRCPSNQLCPCDKVYRSSQYKHPLTESLKGRREVTGLRATYSRLPSP